MARNNYFAFSKFKTNFISHSWDSVFLAKARVQFAK